MPLPPKSHFSIALFYKNSIQISYFLHVSHIFFKSHLSWFYNTNRIWWRVQVTKLLKFHTDTMSYSCFNYCGFRFWIRRRNILNSTFSQKYSDNHKQWSTFTMNIKRRLVHKFGDCSLKFNSKVWRLTVNLLVLCKCKIRILKIWE